jgi:hypothetical protein
VGRHVRIPESAVEELMALRGEAWGGGVRAAVL